VTETPQPSISELHKQWAKLQDEQQPELALAIKRSCAQAAGERQATLLLQINELVAAICDAPVTTIEHFVALPDVSLEHGLDLAPDIASYGPANCPMTARPLPTLELVVREFEIQLGPNLVVTWPARTANRQRGAIVRGSSLRASRTDRIWRAIKDGPKPAADPISGAAAARKASFGAGYAAAFIR
jgi:hypothetical protein